MNGFEKRRNEKKIQIIHALTDLIWTRSLREIGVREIAERAGVSPASIYNFFGSKEELAKQVFYQVTEEVTDELKHLIDDEELTYKEKIKKIFYSSSERQEMLKSEGLKNFTFEDPSFKQHVDELIHKHTIPMFVKLIEQGKAEGKISHGVSARAIMMYADAISVMMSNPEARENMDVGLRKEMTHLFMYGVFGNEAEEK
ncbi:TetR/AcrR family transcriptional regulator [Natribacillus halophilus]|uniref:DNA-binding transcriptional regulator, AcrR family n=1 Tax=Natribacillus halophilus TaxID=549003 RepID=A0A1G8PZH1_9BACI|nr:TetR/AcrR family transcriptional regulator [Natribacillus halophilus]SDI97778.1 DNA-binding transcriptional regulator, AcrR family [Natribacillus halophilus]